MGKILEKGLEKYEGLTRDEYRKRNDELAEKIWSMPIPTVGDILDFMKGNECNSKMEDIFNFFENKDDFIPMFNRRDYIYDQDESEDHIHSVMSANNEDISIAGFFYKKLMASADDLHIKERDCKSHGVEYEVDSLDEDTYNYRIRLSWVNELKRFCKFPFEEFKEICSSKGLNVIHVRSPLTCNLKKERAFCKRCCGLLPHRADIGTFTTLMVTESNTQGCLSAMNNGKKESPIDIIEGVYTDELNWESIDRWIDETCDKLHSFTDVSCRFYQIALLSRVRTDKNGRLSISSVNDSISRSDNLFGAYIFKPTERNLERLIRAREFEDDSLKLQIAMNDFTERRRGIE